MLRTKMPAVLHIALALFVFIAAGSANATLVNFTAQLDGTTYGLTSWSGGRLTGDVDISDTPIQIITNTLTGESVARYSFTGAMELDGAPIVYRNSYVAVFDNLDSSITDSLGFRLYFEPFLVAPGLELIAMNMDTQLSEVTDLSSFERIFDAGELPNGSIYLNILVSPPGDLVLGYSSNDFHLRVVPEPPSLWLVAPALLHLWARRRRGQSPSASTPYCS